MRIEHAPQVIEQGMQPLDQRLTTDDRPGGDVGVAVEILGPAVKRQIKPVLGGAEVHRTGERVVDQRQNLVTLGELDSGSQIRHLHQRVGDGLLHSRSSLAGPTS